jgi:uncharacterized protein YndB with AHSA1/START domain
MTVEPAAAVHRAVVLPVSRERAWEAITDPEELSRWLADEVELDPRDGGAAVFHWRDGGMRVGVVEECAERRRLAFRWSEVDGNGEESLVELTLDDVEGGTRLTVLEVSLAAVRRGDATLAPASAPSAWTPRMAKLAACFVGAWA